jgi:hypothetical protein
MHCAVIGSFNSDIYVGTLASPDASVVHAHAERVSLRIDFHLANVGHVHVQAQPKSWVTAKRRVWNHSNQVKVSPAKTVVVAIVSDLVAIVG